MAGATFILELVRQRTTISHELVLRESMGEDERNLGGLRQTTRNIVILAFLFYVIGALILFPRIQEITGFGIVESLWQIRVPVGLFLQQRRLFHIAGNLGIPARWPSWTTGGLSRQLWSC